MEKKGITYKISEFIVDKRNIFFLIFLIAIVFCAASISKVGINDDITSYLPANTETRRGIDLMDEEFITLGTAQLMISNVTYDRAEEISEYIENIDGVDSVEFDDTDEHYKDAAAFYNITFTGEEDDKESLAAMEEIKEYTGEMDSYIVSEVGKDVTADLAEQMNVILLIAAVVIVLVLLFTSKSYVEIAVFVIVFCVAMILNMGTNYLMGTISYLTNSVAIVLQLALAIDYAIILCHRYMDERENMEIREAVITALSKAIIEISSSSLTTIAGLFAITIMQLRIGWDLGMVLMKGIFFSLITVFILMPGLLMLFGKGIDKTHHKTFVPSIRIWGKIIVKTRYIIAPIFVIAVIAGIVLSGKTQYAFSLNTVSTDNPSVERIARDKIRDVFGESNTIAIIVPSGDYDSEKRVLEQVSEIDGVTETKGLANTTIKDDYDYTLTDKITPQELSEMMDMDVEIVRLLYRAYGIDKEQYGPALLNVDNYKVPLIDMFMYLCERVDEGMIELDDDTTDDIEELYDTLKTARAQLESEKYSRMVVTADISEEGGETFELMDKIRAAAAQYYGEDVMLTGNSTNAKDLNDSFTGDSSKINIITILSVLMILLFTFKSAGAPVLLVFCIQGSIWINFSFPYIQGKNIYFLSYLVVSSIQMGATIDYAIVLTNRYMQLRTELSAKEAVITALDESFPTIITSGSIMTIAGYLIGIIATDPAIGSVGLTLGRGTLTSIIIVMAVLPQLLIFGDRIIENTKIDVKIKPPVPSERPVALVLRGKLSGDSNADIKMLVYGKSDLLKNSRIDVTSFSAEDYNEDMLRLDSGSEEADKGGGKNDEI